MTFSRPLCRQYCCDRMGNQQCSHLHLIYAFGSKKRAWRLFVGCASAKWLSAMRAVSMIWAPGPFRKSATVRFYHAFQLPFAGDTPVAIEVPVEDLFNAVASSTVEMRRSAKPGAYGMIIKVTTSMLSVRPPTISRSNARRTADSSQRDRSLAPSVASVMSKPFLVPPGLTSGAPPASPRPQSPSRLSTSGALPSPSGDELDPSDVSPRNSDGVTKLLISRPSNPRPSVRSSTSSWTGSTISTDRPQRHSFL